MSNMSKLSRDTQNNDCHPLRLQLQNLKWVVIVILRVCTLGSPMEICMGFPQPWDPAVLLHECHQASMPLESSAI